MTKEMANKSIVDQIMDVWFADLRTKKEFDVPTIEKLEHLASRRDLRKPAQVTEAIRLESGGTE